MSKRLIIILGILTLLAYGWPAWTRFAADPSTKTSFSSPPRSDLSRDRNPFMAQDFISPNHPSGIVHVGSICEMPDGRLAAAWYGGTREGAKDVAIFYAEKPPGLDAPWSTPRILVDRTSAAKELNRYIRKVGNPILFSGPGRQLWLIYVTITMGGWSGSSLNVKISQDAGHTWGNSQRLTLSPFFNISELVKGRPLPVNMENMDDGQSGFAVPIYHEFLGYFPEMLWIASSGETLEIAYGKSRMAGGNSFIQPSIAAVDAKQATAFYRCRSRTRRIGVARTKDGGQTWSLPEFLALPNPDSAVDALPLRGGRILLAFNDRPNSRENLRLAVSTDQGLHWIRFHTLENSPDQEFSYPYMIRGRNGWIHLIYTWKRKRVKHVVFNEAWVDEKLKQASDK